MQWTVKTPCRENTRRSKYAQGEISLGKMARSDDMFSRACSCCLPLLKPSVRIRVSPRRFSTVRKHSWRVSRRRHQCLSHLNGFPSENTHISHMFHMVANVPGKPTGTAAVIAAHSGGLGPPPPILCASSATPSNPLCVDLALCESHSYSASLRPSLAIRQLQQSVNPLSRRARAGRLTPRRPLPQPHRTV